MTPTLFDPPPFVRSSATSKAAAESLTPSETEAGRRAMLAAIRLAGEHGMTDLELESLLERQGSWIRPRRRELQKGGLIRDSGLTRATESKRQAVVWIEVTERETGGKS